MMQPKRTYVSPDESCDQQDRPGFISVCGYGSIAAEKNEIGGIFEGASNWRMEHGLWVFSTKCLERIFIVEAECPQP